MRQHPRSRADKQQLRLRGQELGSGWRTLADCSALLVRSNRALCRSRIGSPGLWRPIDRAHLERGGTKEATQRHRQ
jgi:hypothetical protein